jgi:hypothetical protein
MVYTRAQEGPANIGEKTATVQYFDEQGNMIIRSGGTRAWRNNNPGNMVANHYTMGTERLSKAIGKASGFAVYPDYKTGHQALVDMLSGKKWGAKTLQQASIDYTPDNLKHIDSIVEATGFDRTRKIMSLDPLEFEKYWKAIEKIEKWTVGKEEFIDVWYITGVHIKRGVIQEYCLSKNGLDTWISKEEAVGLANEHRIHAILVHSSNGSLYLRPEYKSKRFRDLIC